LGVKAIWLVLYTVDLVLTDLILGSLYFWFTESKFCTYLFLHKQSVIEQQDVDDWLTDYPETPVGYGYHIV